MESKPGFYKRSRKKAFSVTQFNKRLSDLLERLRSIASTAGPIFETIFAHVQCTPDLSEQECNDCLVEAILVLDMGYRCAGKDTW